MLFRSAQGISRSSGSAPSGKEGEQVTSSSLPCAGGPSAGPARGGFPVGEGRLDSDGPELGNESAIAPPFKRTRRFVSGRNYRTDFSRFSRHYFGKDDTHVTACQLADGLRRLLSPRLRPLRYLHSRWDSYPAGTTFAGTGLTPVGTTDLCTAHLDQHTHLSPSPRSGLNLHGHLRAAGDVGGERDGALEGAGLVGIEGQS